MARTGCGWGATANAASPTSVAPRPGRLRPCRRARVQRFLPACTPCNSRVPLPLPVLVLSPLSATIGHDVSSRTLRSYSPCSYVAPSSCSLIDEVAGGYIVGLVDVSRREGRSPGKPLVMPMWLSSIDFVRVRGQTNTCYRDGWLKRKGGRACDRARRKTREGDEFSPGGEWEKESGSGRERENTPTARY